jgi:hypothetical protein
MERVLAVAWGSERVALFLSSLNKAMDSLIKIDTTLVSALEVPLGAMDSLMFSLHSMRNVSNDVIIYCYIYMNQTHPGFDNNLFAFQIFFYQTLS